MNDLVNSPHCGNLRFVSWLSAFIIMSSSKRFLSLREIAAWPLGPSALSSDPDWVAELPSLQRDAVWRPVQIELIWDSIFRGFPIGSLVISERIPGQQSHAGIHARNPWPNTIERRHLLDGQQRCNAITLGYSDPFAINGSPKPHTILWLDLDPPADFPTPGSSRQFLFRVTTTAHPWGYTTGDEITQRNRLTAAEMRETINVCKWKPPEGAPFQRPMPSELRPFKANAPIPLAWVILEAEKHKSPDLWWSAVQQRCAQHATKEWAQKTLRILRSHAGTSADGAKLRRIEEGVQRALSAEVAALEVTKETLYVESLQEGKPLRTNEDAISNVEHMFQRLNNGGTRIDPEELRYSMIKAYWPGIETTISGINSVPMKPSHLALLGARAALASETPKILPKALSITQLRTFARSKDDAEVRKSDLIKRYFALSSDGLSVDSIAGTENGPGIKEVVELIEHWLRHFDGEAAKNDFGLPAVLRSSIAHSSPDVYLLLMILARRALIENANQGALRVPILGLATALHWFSPRKQQHLGLGRIYARLEERSLTRESFSGILNRQSSEDRKQPSWLLPLPNPDELDNLIALPDAESLSGWRWSKLPRVKTAEQDTSAERDEKLQLWQFLECLRGSRELLIYAQRAWMAKRFGDFDRANSSVWDEHNRPWDYDHLLPSTNYTNIKKKEIYMAVCKEWGGTIANLDILPFEDNRSKGARPASASRSDREPSMMLLESESDLKVFEMTRDDVAQNTERVMAFVQCARGRLLRIYKDWFATLEMPFLLGQEVVVPDSTDLSENQFSE